MSSKADNETELEELVYRMARSINLARASYEIWFSIVGKGKAGEEFSSEIHDYRYRDFFDATVAAHRNIMFVEIASLFDPDSRAPSFFNLKKTLSVPDRDLDVHLIDGDLEPYRELIENVREVRNKGAAHHDIDWPEQRLFQEYAIVPNDVGRLLDCCNGLIERQFSETIRLGVAYPVARPGRFEDATYALLDVIGNGRS